MTTNKIGTYVEGIDNNAYHADPEFYSSSQLKTAVHSWANFNWYLKNGKNKDDKWKEGNAMDFGSLVHALLLEPHVVDDEFAFMDTAGRNWRTKEDREYKAKFLDHHKDKIVLSFADRERADICAKEALEHPFLNKLLTVDGKPELSGYFVDSKFALKCRFRPDRLINDLNGGSAILDLKTCYNMDEFDKKAKWEFSYDLSAYMYLKGHHELTGEGDIPFYFGVVESQAPYRVAVFKASDRFLENGKRKYEQACSNILTALKQPMKKVRFQETDYQEI